MCASERIRRPRPPGPPPGEGTPPRCTPVPSQEDGALGAELRAPQASLGFCSSPAAASARTAGFPKPSQRSHTPTSSGWPWRAPALPLRGSKPGTRGSRLVRSVAPPSHATPSTGSYQGQVSAASSRRPRLGPGSDNPGLHLSPSQEALEPTQPIAASDHSVPPRLLHTHPQRAAVSGPEPCYT